MRPPQSSTGRRLRHPRVAIFLLSAATAVALTACGSDSGTTDGTGPEAPGPLSPSVTAQIAVGSSPTAVATGEGGIWVANNEDGTVTRIDPATGKADRKAIAVGDGPSALAVGEGAVWVAAGDDSIHRIDPATMESERLDLEVADPRGIAVGEGSVWVSSGGDGTVIRIDAASLREEGGAIPVGADPGDVAVGEGKVWVVSGDGSVSRIDAGENAVDSTVDVGEFGAFALTLDTGDGSVWVAATDDRLNRQIDLIHIDAESAEIQGDPIQLPKAAIPVRLASGEGAVWATLLGGPQAPDFEELPAQVAYLPDGEDALASERLEVGKRPSGIAVGEGSVWVSSTDRDEVTQIAPR